MASRTIKMGMRARVTGLCYIEPEKDQEEAMEYCDCGAPVAFSPDGVHCLWYSETIASRVVDEDGELLSDPSKRLVVVRCL